MYEKRGINQGGFAPVLIFVLVVVFLAIGLFLFTFWARQNFYDGPGSLRLRHTPFPTSTASPKVYKCPETEYVNCMPGISDEKTGDPGPQMCSNDYLTWAKENCPNFKGAAY